MLGNPNSQRFCAVRDDGRALTPTRALFSSLSLARAQLVLNVSLMVLFPDAISEAVLLSTIFNAVLLGSKAPQLLKLRDVGKQKAALAAELERKTVALKSVQERRSSTAA